MVSLDQQTAPQTRKIDLVEQQLRKFRDVLVIAPPLSGLSTFLNQMGAHISASEIFDRYEVLEIDCGCKRPEREPFELYLHRQLESQNVVRRDGHDISETRLGELLAAVLHSDEQRHFVFILDNLQAVPQNEIRNILQQIRVVSESRRDDPILNRVLFILGGHQIDLRRLDPDKTSPFNVAEKINLEDLDEIEALELIEQTFRHSDLQLSSLAAKYVCYLTGCHPYLVTEVCSHLFGDVVPLFGDKKQIDFRMIDNVVDAMCEDGEDRLLRDMNTAVNELSDLAISELIKLLNGARYRANKSSTLLRELQYKGLVSKSKGPHWKIRNPIYDRFLRKRPLLESAVQYSSFMPRRKFVNIEGYKLLFDLENDLRDFIFAKLYEAKGQNWRKRIDKDLVCKNIGRKQVEVQSGWFPNEDLPELAYSELPDLKKIIEANWSGIFHQYFKPQKIFMGYFEALEGIRNRMAHFRPLTDREISELETYLEKFRDCMYEKS